MGRKELEPKSLELTVTESSSGSAGGKAIEKECWLVLRPLKSSKLAREDVSDRFGPSYSIITSTWIVILRLLKLLPDNIEAADDKGASPPS